MRRSFLLLLVAVIALAWSNCFVDATTTVQTNKLESKNQNINGGIAHRYLRTAVTEYVAGDEERISVPGNAKELLQKMPGVSKLEALFKKNPALAKNLEKAKITEKSSKTLSQFFAENPAIKKELIVAGVLLTLIVTVPIVVKSFYPA